MASPGSVRMQGLLSGYSVVRVRRGGEGQDCTFTARQSSPVTLLHQAAHDRRSALTAEGRSRCHHLMPT
jgi:hypothetical protein